MILWNPNATEGFFKGPLPAYLWTPSSCPRTSLCSQLHHFFIIISMRIMHPSEWQWLRAAHAQWSRLTRNCRCILPLHASTKSCLRALVQRLSMSTKNQFRKLWCPGTTGTINNNKSFTWCTISLSLTQENWYSYHISVILYRLTLACC